MEEFITSFLALIIGFVPIMIILALVFLLSSPTICVGWLYKIYLPRFIHSQKMDETWWHLISVKRNRNGEFYLKIQKEGGHLCYSFVCRLCPGSSEYSIVREILSRENVKKGVYLRFPLVKKDEKVPFEWEVDGEGINLKHLLYQIRHGTP